jgi:hypothetical protein
MLSIIQIVSTYVEAIAAYKGNGFLLGRIEHRSRSVNHDGTVYKAVLNETHPTLMLSVFD